VLTAEQRRVFQPSILEAALRPAGYARASPKEVKLTELVKLRYLL
jgi:hypothetical protein